MPNEPGAADAKPKAKKTAALRRGPARAASQAAQAAQAMQGGLLAGVNEVVARSYIGQGVAAAADHQESVPAGAELTGSTVSTAPKAAVPPSRAESSGPRNHVEERGAEQLADTQSSAPATPAAIAPEQSATSDLQGPSPTDVGSKAQGVLETGSDPAASTTTEQLTGSDPAASTTTEQLTGSDPAASTTTEQLTGSDPAASTTTEQLTGSDPAASTTTEQLTGSDPAASTTTEQLVEKAAADEPDDDSTANMREVGWAHKAVINSWTESTIDVKLHKNEWDTHPFRFTPDLIDAMSKRVANDRRSSGNQLTVAQYVDAAMANLLPPELEAQIALAERFLRMRGQVPAGRQSSHRVSPEVYAVVSRLPDNLRAAGRGRTAVHIYSAVMHEFLKQLEVEGPLK